MSILNTIRSQLRSVIEWEQPDPGELFELWSSNGDEIKNASKLLVKPGQGAIFVYEGKVQAIHVEEGLYEIKTANIPFLTTLSKFMQSFVSEHKVAVYFFWRTEFLNQKWGTVSPIKYLDPIYKFPVSLRAFGNFTFQLTDPKMFFTAVVGSRNVYSIDEIRITIAQRITQPLTDILATAGYGVVEVDKHREELATAMVQKISADFSTLGFALKDFRVEGTDFDEGTKARIDRIADITADSEAAKAAGLNYAQLQQLQALRDAAKNPGGIAGMGVGLGAGVMVGQTMGSMFGSMPGMVPTAEDPGARIKKLQGLLEGGLITQAEFEEKKKDILKNI